MRPVIVAACAALSLVCSPAYAQYSRKSPVTEAVAKVQDGVVSLKVVKDGEYGSRNIQGTGIIVDERGYVITNHHVAAGAARITAQLADGTKLAARVQLTDIKHDLAILRLVTDKKLKALPFGPSSDLMKGESIITVGNPYGYDQTVTTGIVAGLGREITMPTGETLKGIIQTNAAINPGNSGGPLLNINGEVIGVVVALREGAQCIAFALNADTVKAWLARHLSAAKVSRIDHGIRTTEKLAEDAPCRSRVVVAAASCDAVKKGDVIVKVGKLPVTNGFDLERAMWGHKAGDRVEASVLRDGKLTKVSLPLTSAARDSLTSR
jgi:serine protease Do